MFTDVRLKGAVERVEMLLRVQEAQCSTLCLETILTKVFNDFPQSLQENVITMSQIRPELLPVTALPIQ
jgi:hypothetical protein